MLLHLSIRDFAIVARLELEFRPGFTALTGETGAGKSILIDAVSLALGNRAASEQVRSGAERADVTAEFAIESLPGVANWLGDQALEGDPNRLLLCRTIGKSIRPRSRLAEPLISHPSTRLLKRRIQRSWISGRTGAGSKPIPPPILRCHRNRLALRARTPMTSRSKSTAPTTGRIYGCNLFRLPTSRHCLLYQGRSPYRVIGQWQADMPEQTRATGRRTSHGGERRPQSEVLKDALHGSRILD